MAKNYFSNSGLLEDLASSSSKGGFWLLLSQIMLLAIDVLTVSFLARILSPSDFGILGMVTIIFLFAGQISQLGMGEAIIQKKEINHDEISSLFWFNSTIALLLSLLVIASAPLISAFYNVEALKKLTIVLAPTILFTGLAVQNNALLTRTKSFKSIALINILSGLIASITAIVLALKGFNYWSLAWRLIIIVFLRSSLLFLVTRWIPSLPKKNISIRDYIKFGSNLAGFNLLNSLSRNLDNIIVGKLFGATILGFYSRAYFLVLIPSNEFNGPLARAILPALSRVSSEPIRFTYIYTRFLSLVSCFTIPFIFFIGISAYELFFILLGDGWEMAALFTILLLPVAYVNATNFAEGIVYNSLGTTNRQLNWGMISTPLTILGMVVGSVWGPIGIAVGVSCAFLILKPISLIYCYKSTPLSLILYFKSIIRPTIISALSGAMVLLIAYYITACSEQVKNNNYLLFVVKLLSFGSLWLLLDLILPGRIKAYTLVKDYLKNLLTKSN